MADDLIAWLVRTVGVGSVAGIVYAGAMLLWQRLQQRVTFWAWMIVGISEKLKLVVYNKSPDAFFIQYVTIEEIDKTITFANDDRGGIYETIDPGPPYSKDVPRRCWEFDIDLPDGAPEFVTLLVVGFVGTPEKLKTWRVKASVVNG